MRVLNRVLGLLLGLVAAAIGALVAIESGLRSADRDALVVHRRRWDRSLSDLMWSSSTLELVAIITIAVGAIVVLLQVVPRRPRRLALVGTAGRRAWITPASVRRAIERSILDDHDDVARAEARVGRGRVRVRITMVANADADTPDRVGQRTAEVLDGLELERDVRVRVRVEHNDDRVR